MCSAEGGNQGSYALLIMANKPETALYRARTFLFLYRAVYYRRSGNVCCQIHEIVLTMNS